MTQVVRDRSWLGMGVFTLVVIGVLVALGVWQLQRRVEKHALIAALTERLGAAAMPLPPPAQWSALNPDNDEFRRVTVTAAFRDAPDAKVFTSGSALRPDVKTLGTFVFAPAALSEGATIVIDRGFVPDGSSAADTSHQPMTLTGYLRFPEKPGWITPAPDLNKRVWYARDHLDMAKALSWGPVAPFYIDLESPAPSSGLPKPGPLEVHLRDEHLQYAITWFGLAAVVAIAFAIWLRGRIRGEAAT
jgi:cytochrome oxidase assembly protein ShyY1